MKNTNLGQYVFVVLIPTEKVYQIRNGKRQSKREIICLGYVLIEAILGDTVHQLKNMPNVIGFLGGNTSKATPLRQSEVNRILGNSQSTSRNEEELNIPFYVGETVKVMDPFQGFFGRY